MTHVPSRRGRPLRLVTLLLPTLLLAACSGPAAETAAPSGTPAPTLTPVPGGLLPTPTPRADATATSTEDPAGPFTPPDPICPAPPVAVEAPRMLASVRGASYLMNAGSSGVITCSTSASSDVVPADPTTPLHVETGDRVHVGLPPGWHFLFWEGWDKAPGAQDANAIPGGRTPERPTAIDVPIPGRLGASILGVHAWVSSADGRVISGIEGTVLVER